jgi:hypothetical protein
MERPRRPAGLLTCHLSAWPFDVMCLVDLTHRLHERYCLGDDEPGIAAHPQGIGMRRGQTGRLASPCRVWKVPHTVPVHAGEDLKPGTLRAIERDLEPCLGEHWLRKR